MTIKKLHTQINSIINQIINKYKPEQIYLLGSMARGKYHQDSDLDLLIVKENVPESGIERRWQVRRLVEKHNIPVDFLVVKKTEFNKRKRLGDPFIKVILAEGKLLYSRT